MRRTVDREQLIALYRQAIDVTARDAKLVRRQAQFAETLGDMYAVAEEYDKAVEAYSELSPTVSPLSLLGKLGLALLIIDPDRAITVLSQVVPAVPHNYTNDMRWRLEAGLVWALSLAGRSYDAVRRSRDVLGTLSSTTGLGFARSLIRGVLGMTLFYVGDQMEAHPHLESARAGWGARGDQEGVLFINQVLIAMPKEDVTKNWVRLLLYPLIDETG
jgi:hypothetical protein